MWAMPTSSINSPDMAPLIAVRGNNDTQIWAARLAQTELVRIGGIFLYVIHDLEELDIDPAAAGVRVVVSGHSHRPKIEERAGILYVNPGSCGPRRFKLPISAGELTVSGNAVNARIVELLLRRINTADPTQAVQRTAQQRRHPEQPWLRQRPALDEYGGPGAARRIHRGVGDGNADPVDAGDKIPESPAKIKPKPDIPALTQ